MTSKIDDAVLSCEEACCVVEEVVITKCGFLWSWWTLEFLEGCGGS